MAGPHPDTPPTSGAVTIHTVPLPADAKVLVLVEADAHVSHVITLTAQAARDLVVGLLEAIDLAAPDDDRAWWDGGPRP